MGNKPLRLPKPFSAAPESPAPIGRSRWWWVAGVLAIAVAFAVLREPLAAVILSLSGLVIAGARPGTLPLPERADTVVVIGGNLTAAMLAETLREQSDAPRRVRFRQRGALHFQSILRATTLDEAASFVRTARCDEVVLVDDDRHQVATAPLIDVRGRQVALLSGPEMLERLLGRLPLELVERLPGPLPLGRRSAPRHYVVAKRAVDVLVAVILGLAVLPLLPVMALVIRLESPGSPLFSQTRVGQDGKPFRLRKFRTMRRDAERDGAVWAQLDDPRVTRVGHFLRSTRLDELPQLWNVLRGEMTLVGPRPERPEFTRLLDQEVPAFALRTLVKPGLTGWAQICFRYTRTVEDARTKLEYDLYYVRHASFWFDVQILARTAGVMLRRLGS